MKVKTMKKALSVLCASAMVAGTFAVADMGTVEAATKWNPDFATGNTKYVKVPYTDLTCIATSWTTAEGTRKADQLVDGNVGSDSYYHSNYGAGTGSRPNFTGGTDNTGTDNKLTIELKNAKDVVGISYLARQTGSEILNGTVKKLSVQEETSPGVWSDIQLKNGGTEANFTYDGTWETAKEEEKIVEFAETKKDINKLRIVVKDGHGQHISGAELSVLTPVVYNADGLYEVAEFIDATGHRTPAPAPAGKIFAGWYTDTTYATAFTANKGQAYAKFVDANVLTEKTQISAATDSYATESQLRFVSSVDSLNYKTVGFEVQVANHPVKKYESKQVYANLYVVGGSTDTMTVTPNQTFASTSTHFFAWNLTGIPKGNFGTDIKVTPYWVTLDGTKVSGETRTVNVNDVMKKQYTNTIKYTYDNSGKESGFENGTMPADWVSPGALKRTNDATKMKITGDWWVYPAQSAFQLHNNEWNLGEKLEISNGNGASIEYTFEGTGIALFYQDRNSTSFKVKVLDSNGNPVIGKDEITVADAGDLNKALGYSVRNLPKATYKLVVTGLNSKACAIDSFYVVK